MSKKGIIVPLVEFSCRLNEMCINHCSSQVNAQNMFSVAIQALRPALPSEVPIFSPRGVCLV